MPAKKQLDVETPRLFLWELVSYGYNEAFGHFQDAARPLFELSPPEQDRWRFWLEGDFRLGPIPEWTPERFLLLSREKKVERIGDASGTFGGGLGLVSTRMRELLVMVGVGVVTGEGQQALTRAKASKAQPDGQGRRICYPVVRRT